MWWLGCSCRSELTVVAVRATEQRSVWRDGDVSDGGSQAGQEVALVFLVFPLDENRLDTSAQQVGAWVEKQNTHNRRQSRTLTPMKKVGFAGLLPSGVKHSELSALWCQCRVVYVYSFLWLKFLLEIKSKQTAGNKFQGDLGWLLLHEMDKDGFFH